MQFKKEEVFKMSVFPKIIERKKETSVTLHMHIENALKEKVMGKIVIIVISPMKEKTIIEEEITIKGLSIIDKYYQYDIKKDFPIGRYYANGGFYFKGRRIRSKTYKNDYFDVF